MVAQVLTVSKLDAAKRQLDTAIMLFFHDADPVSIHTLSAAAYNVLHGVSRARGGKPMLTKEVFLEHVREDCQAEVRKLLNESENFFKHADRDPEETHEFRTDKTEWLIFDSVIKYHELAGEDPPMQKLFRAWFVLVHPNRFKHPPEQQPGINELQREFGSLGKQAFFAAYLPIAMSPLPPAG